MSILIKELDVPEKVRTIKQYCPDKIKIFDDYISFEGQRPQTYFYKDYTGVSTQNASILCAYASLIFLNPVSANQTWKNDMPVLTDMNRVLFSSGMFSYKAANEYVQEIAGMVRDVFEAYKRGEDKRHSIDPITEIRKYKELLDEGIISQEEFDAKKKQILS